LVVGSYMTLTLKQFAACAGLFAAILGSAGCAPKRIPPMTVQDLMEDRVTLDGVLLKCSEHPEKVKNVSDCLNARVAVERLAKDVDPAEEARRNAEFERSREKLRLAQEKVRHDQEAKTKVDAYNLPVMPVETVTSNGGASGTAPAQP
jgi:hypothetical protein